MNTGLAQSSNFQAVVPSESLDSWYRWSELDLQFQRGEQHAAEYLVGLSPLAPEVSEPG